MSRERNNEEDSPMRDLKHLIFFENLLQEANNDLVKQARNEGRKALGYTCGRPAAPRRTWPPTTYPAAPATTGAA